MNDVNEVISMGILVVNDGLACQNKVAEVLQCCNYEVLLTGTVYDALHAIWENKDRFDLVITNVQNLELEGVAIIQNIKERLKMNVLLIRSDERIEPKGELLSFSAYCLNGLSVNGLNNLLENAKRVEEDKVGTAAVYQQENVQTASVSNIAAVETNKTSSSIKDAACLDQTTRKAVELHRERSEESNDDHYKGKKPRVTWTNEMHQKFLNAIETLGYDKAVPKKIVEVMGVPGLTRENVASHLQKYRCSMRRTQETIFGSLPCRSMGAELGGLGILTSPSTSKDLLFNSRSERKFCTRIGVSHLSDVRNVMQRRDSKRCSTHNSNHSDTSKFVGYRFIGNQIDYGPINKINTGCLDQSTGYGQNHPISDQNAIGAASCIQSSLLGSSASRTHGTETSQEPDLVSSYASKIDSLLKGPPTQQSGDCSNSLLDQLQSWDSYANAVPLATSSVLPPPHQDLYLLPLEPPENAFSEPTPAGFFDDVLQQHCSPSPPPPPPPRLTEMFQNLDEIFEQGGDDYLINGIGNTYGQFNIQEFDDTLLSRGN